MHYFLYRQSKLWLIKICILIGWKIKWWTNSKNVKLLPKNKPFVFLMKYSLLKVILKHNVHLNLTEPNVNSHLVSNMMDNSFILFIFISIFFIQIIIFEILGTTNLRNKNWYLINFCLLFLILLLLKNKDKSCS